MYRNIGIRNGNIKINCDIPHPHHKLSAKKGTAKGHLLL